MKRSNENKRGRVAEPVQVYLDRTERGRLEWLSEALGQSKSDILRSALEALEREVSDPAGHPALRMIGLAGAVPPAPYDVAREHDRFLADAEVASWKRRPARRRAR